MSNPNESTTRGKKPKGRYVASRFKQAAESYSSSHSSEGTFSLANKTQGADRLKVPVQKNDNQNETLTEKKISTPTKSGTAMPNFNVSGMPNTCSVPNPKKDRKVHTVQKHCVQSTAKKDPPRKYVVKDASNQKQLDAEMDIYYARYQQQIFLEHKAKRSLLAKSEQAKEKFGQVCCYIQYLMEKNHKIKRNINTVSLELKLHEHLVKQNKSLSSVLKVIPSFEKKYEEMAVRVDGVRHKLRVQDAIVPKGSSEDEMVETLNKIHNSMKEVLSLVGNVDEIVESSDAMASYASKAKAVGGEIKKTSDLLEESRDLLLSEAFLKLTTNISDEES